MNKHIEEKVEEYKAKYKGILSDEVIEQGAQWYREALTSIYQKGREDERKHLRIKTEDLSMLNAVVNHANKDMKSAHPEYPVIEKTHAISLCKRFLGSWISSKQVTRPL